MKNFKDILFTGIENPAESDICLSMYLNNESEETLRESAKQGMKEAIRLLSPVMSSEALSAFLRPIVSTLQTPHLHDSYRKNIALFRSPRSMRVVNIPVNVQPLTVVSSSFHIKPFLQWEQYETPFILLGLSYHGLDIYRCSSTNHEFVDRILLPRKFRVPSADGHYGDIRGAKGLIKELSGLFRLMETQLTDIIGSKVEEPIVLVGNHQLVDIFLDRVNSHEIVPWFSRHSFYSDQILDIVREIREALNQEKKFEVHSEIYRLKYSIRQGEIEPDIFKVAQAAMEGRVRKLFISDQKNIWGRIKPNGNLHVRPYQQDHRDDDLLDDIAQHVIKTGGKVIVENCDMFPDNHPLYAVIESDTEIQREVGALVSA